MGKKAREQRRAAEKERRVKLSRAEELMRKLLGIIIDEQADPTEAAANMLLLYRIDEDAHELVFQTARKLKPQHATGIIDAMIASNTYDATAFAAAAAIAEAQDDGARGLELLGRAMELEPDVDEHRWGYAMCLEDLGRYADALDMAVPLCRDDAFDDNWQDVLADSLRRAHEALQDLDDADRCVCDSGAMFVACCKKRLRDHLAWFSDRRGIVELTHRLRMFTTADPQCRPFVEHATERWMEGTGAAVEPEDRALFEEWSWQTVLVDEHDENNDEEDSILVRYVGDDYGRPLADRAQIWEDDACWGLWLVRDPDAQPWMVLLDVLTGSRRIVEVPAAQRKGLCRWHVLLGYVSSFDGVWRVGEGAVWLDPATADRAAEMIVAIVLRALDVRGRRAERFDPWNGLPATVAAETGGLAPPEMARFISMIVLTMFPVILGTIREGQTTLPTLANTDGDPLKFVTVEIAVDDGAHLRKRFAETEEFDARENGGINWRGREMSASEAAASQAELRAYARKHKVEWQPQERPRYTRGFLSLEGDTIKTQLNSTQRLDALMVALSEMGANPRIVSKVVADPVEDLGLGLRPGLAPAARPPQAGSSVSSALPAEAGSGQAFVAWTRAWVDEKVPALNNMTPRRAAQDPSGRMRLEALLRQFEHRAFKGHGNPETVKELRETLGMN